jgi:Ca2+/H+ antiporter
MSYEPADDPRRAFVLNNPKKTGALLVLAGAFIGHLTIYRPILAAHEGAESVTEAHKGSALSVIFLLFGFMYLFGSRKLVEMLWPRSGEWTRMNYMMIGGAVVIVLAVPALMKLYLESFGYTL